MITENPLHNVPQVVVFSFCGVGEIPILSAERGKFTIKLNPPPTLEDSNKYNLIWYPRFYYLT